MEQAFISTEEKLDECVCPVCKNRQNELLSSYPGNFLEIKKLFKCNICDLVFGYKIPNKKEVDKYYETGLFYDGIPNKFDQKLLNWHFKVSETRLDVVLNNTSNNLKNVIDIGGGYGKFGHVLNSRSSKIIYDIVEPDPNVNSIWGDWVNDNFNHISEVKDGFYDLAILCHVLEHVPDPNEFFALIKSKMKPKGFIFVDIPYKDYLFKENISPHITFWNEKSIKYFAQKNNLDIVFLNTVGLSHKLCRVMFKNKTFLHKVLNPWIYVNKIKDILNRNEIPFFTDERMFGLNKYGGNRMWLRCILKTR
jgi:SAM-dependent methyltransferase